MTIIIVITCRIRAKLEDVITIKLTKKQKRNCLQHVITVIQTSISLSINIKTVI